MIGKDNTERRKYPRAKFDATVIVHKVVESNSGNVFEVQGTPIAAKSTDVSEGGIRLEMAKSSPFTKILKLNFQILKNKSVDVYTRVAWEGDGSCGLQFIVLDDEIRKQIRSMAK
jgi:hypothetical protein